MSAPIATVKAYRRTGGAVVTVERQGRPSHCYVVTLRRYHALREWTLTRCARHWRTSGAWMRSSMVCSIWGGAVMSAGLVVAIAPDVAVAKLAEALATAGLVVRSDFGRLVIRPAGPSRMRTVAPELSRLLNRLSLTGGSAYPD